MELEVIDEYELFAQKRFVISLKNSNITFNVAASSREEALRKVERALLPSAKEP